MKRNKKHQHYKFEEILEEDIHLNLNPEFNKTFKENQDCIKAQQQAKESLERHKHILEQD